MNQPNNIGKVLRITQVSEMTGVPEATLRWWRHVGSGPKSFKIGRAVAYLESDVEAWLGEQYDGRPSEADVAAERVIAAKTLRVAADRYLEASRGMPMAPREVAEWLRRSADVIEKG